MILEVGQIFICPAEPRYNDEITKNDADYDQLASINHHHTGQAAIKNANTINRNSVFDCHLSPHWRQMAIKNTVSIDF